MNRDYNPKVIASREGLPFALITADPLNGYSYVIVDHDKLVSKDPVWYGSSGGYATMTEAEQAARQHLAQWVCDLNNDDGSYLILNDYDLAQHMYWVNWQRCYAAWRKTGIDDYDRLRELADIGKMPE